MSLALSLALNLALGVSLLEEGQLPIMKSCDLYFVFCKVLASWNDQEILQLSSHGFLCNKATDLTLKKMTSMHKVVVIY